MRPLYTALAFIAVFAAGAALGVWVPAAPTPAVHELVKDSLQQDAGSGTASLTNPLLDCADLPTAISESGVDALHNDISDYISSEKTIGAVTDASVYYRDLNNGPWTIVGSSERYAPASLLKVPLAMSFYRVAENTPSTLAKKIVYKPDPSIQNEVQPYTPKENVVAGQTYTVQDLIRIMLEQSSNEAAVALASLASTNQILGVYSDLGLSPPVLGQDYTIGVKDFSSFIRILYNATYLSRKDSETVLELLTHTDYSSGLVAGVPKNVVVAHKFGSRALTDGSFELHDCGIIYFKQSPYMLCVMTHGSDFTTLSSVIAHISSMTYQYALSH